MDLVMSAVNELGQAFEQFKENHKQKMETLERASLRSQRFETLATGCSPMEDITLKSFRNYLAKGDEQYLQTLTTKALSTNGEDGGYFIPRTLEARLQQKVEDYSPIRRLANVMTISSNSLELLLEKKGPEAGWAQEEAERPATNTPQLHKVKIIAHELYARPRATERLLADASHSVEEWLTYTVAKKLAQMENYAFIHGDGNSKPKGFLDYETVSADAWEWGKLEHILTGENQQFVDQTGMDKLLETVGALKSIYLKEAVWVMSRAALLSLQKLRDGDGTYILEPGNTRESRSILLGYPVEILEDMPGFGDANKCSIVFGNFKEAYQIVEHPGIQILRDPYSSKPLIEFYTTKRVGGGVVNFEALKVLKFSS